MGKTTPKTKAWGAFSEYIRVRDCLATTGLPFVGVCITCGRQYHIKVLDAGHCLAGRGNAKLFNEKLVNAQCKIWCNIGHHGQVKKYKKKMEAKYGKEAFEQMVIDSRKIIQDKKMDFPAIEAKYKQKLEDLLAGKATEGIG